MEQFEGRAVIVRKAAETDALEVLAWRNDPLTRAMSRTPGEVGELTHRAWFSRALNDPQVTLLIGEVDGQNVGMVRFDHGEETEVSINVNPRCRARGHGHALLSQALTWVEGEVWAVIKPENLASQRLFERAGFTLQNSGDNPCRYRRRAG